MNDSWVHVTTTCSRLHTHAVVSLALMWRGALGYTTTSSPLCLLTICSNLNLNIVSSNTSAFRIQDFRIWTCFFVWSQSPKLTTTKNTFADHAAQWRVSSTKKRKYSNISYRVKVVERVNVIHVKISKRPQACRSDAFSIKSFWEIGVVFEASIWSISQSSDWTICRLLTRKNRSVVSLGIYNSSCTTLTI